MSELAILRALRLKGRADADGVASATDLDAGGVRTVLDALVASGEAREAAGNYMLLPPGRERLATLLEAERETVDSAAVTDAYERFTAVNGDFKQLAHDWQMRDGQPNDHADPA